MGLLIGTGSGGQIVDREELEISASLNVKR
jgi:hypothetical protein